MPGSHLHMVVNDIHATKVPPSSCTDSYFEDLMGLLAQTYSVAMDYRCESVTWAGDVFHHKAASRTSHEVVQRLLLVGQAYLGAGMRWYIVPGNHDITHDRLASIDESQPLGVLFKAGASRLEGWALNDGGKRWDPLYGVPWQQKWDDESVAEALREYREHPDGSLIITHAPLYPPGRELPWEHYPAERFAEAMGPGSGFVAYGHVHEPHGLWSVGDYATGKTFCNNGALSRGSLHEYNLSRQVGVTMWNGQTCEFGFVALNAKPAEQVFRLREKAQVADMAGRLDEFLAQVSGTALETVSLETVMEGLRAAGTAPDELALAEELLGFARTEAAK